jgi:hypothetical protein
MDDAGGCEARSDCGQPAAAAGATALCLLGRLLCTGEPHSNDGHLGRKFAAAPTTTTMPLLPSYFSASKAGCHNSSEQGLWMGLEWQKSSIERQAQSKFGSHWKGGQSGCRYGPINLRAVLNPSDIDVDTLGVRKGQWKMEGSARIYSTDGPD